MHKKLIFLVSLMFFFNTLLANEKIIIPLKKPSLSNQELNKKVLINILKPLPKPKEKGKEEKLKKVVKEKKYKTNICYLKRNQ